MASVQPSLHGRITLSVATHMMRLIQVNYLDVYRHAGTDTRFFFSPVIQSVNFLHNLIFQSGNIKFYWERMPLFLAVWLHAWSIKRIWQWHWNRANCLVPNHKKNTCTNQLRHFGVLKTICIIIFNLAKRYKSHHKLIMTPRVAFQCI